MRNILKNANLEQDINPYQSPESIKIDDRPFDNRPFFDRHPNIYYTLATAAVVLTLSPLVYILMKR